MQPGAADYLLWTQHSTEEIDEWHRRYLVGGQTPPCLLAWLILDDGGMWLRCWSRQGWQPRVRQLVDPRFLLVNASAHGSPVIDAAFSDAWEGAFVLRSPGNLCHPKSIVSLQISIKCRICSAFCCKQVCKWLF